MAMSKKDMEKKKNAKREKIAELEKLASSGSKDAKKKLAKAKKKGGTRTSRRFDASFKADIPR